MLTINERAENPDLAGILSPCSRFNLMRCVIIRPDKAAKSHHPTTPGYNMDVRHYSFKKVFIVRLHLYHQSRDARSNLDRMH